MIILKENYKNLIGVKFFRQFFLLLFIQLIILLFLSIFHSDIKFSLMRDVSISLIILLISYSMPLKEKERNNLNLAFLVSITISALTIIQHYASGFVINELYFPIPKNQLAPVFGSGAIVGFYNFFKIKNKKKYIYLVCSILLFMSILVIRGRSVIMSVIVCLLILMFFYIKSLKIKLYFLFASVILIALLWPLIYNSLFLNYDINDIDSISTGRSATYNEAFSLILNYPFFGEFEYIKYNEYTTHNYILNLLVKFGIILCIPLLLIYFKIIIKVISGILQNSFKEIESGLLLMLMLFFVSMFEYSYPFSPVSATIFPFFMFGQILYFKDRKRLQIKFSAK